MFACSARRPLLLQTSALRTSTLSLSYNCACLQARRVRWATVRQPFRSLRRGPTISCRLRRPCWAQRCSLHRVQWHAPVLDFPHRCRSTARGRTVRLEPRSTGAREELVHPCVLFACTCSVAHCDERVSWLVRARTPVCGNSYMQVRRGVSRLLQRC